MRAGFRAVVVEATIPQQAKPSPTDAAANRSLRKGQVIVPVLYTAEESPFNICSTVKYIGKFTVKILHKVSLIHTIYIKEMYNSECQTL